MEKTFTKSNEGSKDRVVRQDFAEQRPLKDVSCPDGKAQENFLAEKTVLIIQYRQIPNGRILLAGGASQDSCSSESSWWPRPPAVPM